MLGGCIAEEVGHGMKAHLDMDRNDPVEGMRERNKFFGKGSRDRP